MSSMMMPVLYGLPPGLSSMMEKQPQILCSLHAALNLATSGPSSEHMIASSVAIERPCSEYSGNTTRSIVPRLRRAFPTISTMRSVCLRSSSGVETTGSCSCTTPITTPLGDLLSPPSPLLMVCVTGVTGQRLCAKGGTRRSKPPKTALVHHA